ncbi:hypothetical protein FACS1894199_09850 [Bacteroidia bacterium]|nr:hypothetical protein FACS1894199_09850 [Bacteroidia bacterium]
MKYTRNDLKAFKNRGIKKEDIDKQMQNFKEGFDFVELAAPATLDDGIKAFDEIERSFLIELYEQASAKADVVKMVPASGSASRMFKDLYQFMDSYSGSTEDFLKFVQEKDHNSMYNFFVNLKDFPFYTRLKNAMWEKGKDLEKALEKREYKEVLEFILDKKGLNYGDMPKGLVDFHVYRDFVRTAFDEHFVEAALYAGNGKITKLHFTVSANYLNLVKRRMLKVMPIFEKMFRVKFKVTYSIQEPSTDTVSVYKNGDIVRDENNAILFRPGGHGALIHNLNNIKADLIFIKNIDNVAPDRNKQERVMYKKLLAGALLETQSKVFELLEQLGKRNITDRELDEIERFTEHLGYRKPKNLKFKVRKERVKFLKNILDRPIRVCGMVKNEGEPGGGPFWVKEKDGSERLMIIESAQVNTKDKHQKKIFAKATHFNPVDILCGTRDHKGKFFNLMKYVDEKQGFITAKSYKGKDIYVQELPGLWNGAMSKWITLFVEEPLSTFTPVKTVFDLRRTEHANVFFNNNA